MAPATLISYQPGQLTERNTWKSTNQPNRRAGSKISPIWQHGLELRAMDSPNFDKYWLCGLCPLQTVIMEITKDTNSNTTAAMRHLKTIHKVSFYSIDEFISSQLPGRPHSQLGRYYTLSAGLASRRVGNAGPHFDVCILTRLELKSERNKPHFDACVLFHW